MVEQDRVATAQIQIELSTEMNEQLQLQITDLTTAIEQLRDRPTEHTRKQTDTLTVTAVQKAAAPPKAAAVERTRVLPGKTATGWWGQSTIRMDTWIRGADGQLRMRTSG